jgi:hypothetical protein
VHRELPLKNFNAEVLAPRYFKANLMHFILRKPERLLVILFEPSGSISCPENGFLRIPGEPRLKFNLGEKERITN